MTMDGDNMKRGVKNFFKRKQYTIAAAAVLVAVLGITGVYYLGDLNGSDEPEQQVAMEEPKETKKVVTATQKEEDEEESEQTSKVSTVIPPKNTVDTVEEDTEATMTALEETAEEKEQETAQASTVVEAKPAAEVHFDATAGLIWPVDGAVILDYSMDQTVYFTTLDQYKYNPAVVIAGNVNEKVKAAASGTITDVSTNEVTGCTVTMDIGDGYTAIYGQLKEVPYAAGTYVEAGNTLGFISEPTKYYSLEGSNVYFELQKDGNPIDPIELFQ